MHRGMLPSATLHLGTAAGLLCLSLQTELPPVAPPSPPPTYATCFYSLVDARSLLAGASTSEVAVFIGSSAPKLPEAGRVTVCLHFNGDRTLLLVLLDGRVAQSTWAEDVTATQGCEGRQVSVPRSADAAGYLGPCPGEFVPLLM
jgi:hypothetical protein